MESMTRLPIGFTKFYFVCIRETFFHSKWLLSIMDCLISSGHDIVWNSQDTVRVPQTICKMVKLKLIENYNKVWTESVFNPPNVSTIECSRPF